MTQPFQLTGEAGPSLDSSAREGQAGSNPRHSTPSDQATRRAVGFGGLSSSGEQHSIRSRLQRLVILSVGLALICSAILDLWQEAHTYLLDKREGLLATANVVAGASSKAVASRDIGDVEDSLRSVARVPGLAYARVEDTTGQLLAQAGATVRLNGELSIDSSEAGSLYDLLRTRTVQVTVPVVYAGRAVGRLILVSAARDVAARFVGVLAKGALGALLALGLGLFVAHRLQRSITTPLSALAQEMARIAQTHDYSASVPPTSDAETEMLAGSFNAMMAEIRKASTAIVNREAELIRRLSRATEKRDHETGAHIERMAGLCGLIAEAMGLQASEADGLRRAAPLHDVGKIALPDAIMLKTGKLDPDERREMEKHTTHGYEILRDSESDLIRLAAEIAWSHHERWDGTGYPRRLKGEEIPLSGRIAAVADVCDALASERPYKAAWSLDDVRAYLVANRAGHFDPACVEALLNRWDDVRKTYAADTRPSV